MTLNNARERCHTNMGTNTLLLDTKCYFGQCFMHPRYHTTMENHQERVKFDVSGQLFTIYKDKLTSGPQSNVKSLYYEKRSQESIYIDREPCAFGAIIAWYQTGELHIPMSLCPGSFLKELKFWDIKHTNLKSCCLYRLKCFLDEQETLRKFQKAVSEDDDDKSQVVRNTLPSRRNFRSRVWSVVDYCENTWSAMAYFILTLLMVLLSIFVPAYMTDPVFQRAMTNCERLKVMQYNQMDDVSLVEPYLRDCSKDSLPFNNVTTHGPSILAEDNQIVGSNGNQREGTGKQFLDDIGFFYAMIKVNATIETNDTEIKDALNEKWKVVKIPNNHLPVRPLVILETATAAFFLFDFAVRLISCPNISRYFKSFINVSDAVSLIGVLVHTIMLQCYSHTRHNDDTWVVLLEYLQMLRSFRLLRIVKNVTASRVLVYSIFQNIKDLSVLGLFLVVGTCIFASILYVCEDSSTVNSIPVGWYWALVTMTTVGYGDVTPKTAFGKFFACLCATSGVLLFALTVPIFTNHFMTLYQYSAITAMDQDEQVSDVVDDIKVMGTHTGGKNTNGHVRRTRIEVDTHLNQAEQIV